MKPSVSIIIPTFNRAKFLKRAVESILKQDYKNIIEIIVTDDGSTDETENVVKKFQQIDPRIIFVKNTKYLHGPTGNKNNGLDYATGEFIGILDDDDELLPTSISELINVYLRLGYKHILANGLYRQTNKLIGKSYGKSEEITYKDLLCQRYDGDYWSIISRDLIGDDRFVDATYGAERLLWFKIYKKAPIYYLDKIVVIIDNSTNNRVQENYLKFPDRTFLNYKLTLDMFGEDFKKLCPKLFIKNCLLTAFYARLVGKYKEFFRYTLLLFKARKLFLLKLFCLFFLLLPFTAKFTIYLYNFIKKNNFIKQFLFSDKA